MSYYNHHAVQPNTTPILSGEAAIKLCRRNGRDEVLVEQIDPSDEDFHVDVNEGAGIVFNYRDAEDLEQQS